MTFTVLVAPNSEAAEEVQVDRQFTWVSPWMTLKLMAVNISRAVGSGLQAVGPQHGAVLGDLSSI